MERILKSTVATLSVTFTIDGEPTDPSPATATVQILRADGTELVAAGTATTRTGVGEFVRNLTATDTALLDILSLRWTSSLGTVETVAEIVGGFLFTIAEARALKPLDNTTLYPTDQIVETRTLVEQALEDACDVAFVPRYAHATLSGSGGPLLACPNPRVRSIRSATIAGRDVTADVTSAGGFAYYPPVWTAGYANVVVGYEHGYDRPPERVRRAALRLAKRWLVEGPVDDRATSMSNEDGTFALVTPGVRGTLFDLPEVNAVVDQYSAKALVC